MPLIIAGIVIALICFVIAFIVEKVEDFFIATASFWGFCGQNILSFCGLGCFVLALFVFVYFKPHPAEKHFKLYKTGKLARGQAIKKIGDTMYSPKQGKTPLAYQSKILEKRINALKKRVKAETSFLEELTKYIIAKSRLE